MEEETQLVGLSTSSIDLSKIKQLNIPALPEGFLEVKYSTTDITDKVLPTDEAKTRPIQNNCAFPFANGSIFISSIASAIQLTDGEDVKETIDLSLDFSGSGIEFQPGDTIGIIPRNSDKEVTRILECLQLTAYCDLKYVLLIKDMPTSKKKISIPPYIPTNSTIRHVLETCLDIRSVPKKLFLRVLSEYTSDLDEKRRLQELCSKQGTTEYSRFIVEARTTLPDLLEAFPSCCPPVERLFEFLPRLQARPYSIASSPLAGSLVHIVFSLITLPGSFMTQARRGLCTEWMYSISNITPKAKTLTQHLKKLSLENEPRDMGRIPLFLRKSNAFILPKDPATPLILIGPGTGIAPFIAFLQHRQLQLKISPDLNCGEIWLFSGCRYSDRDFLFDHQISDFLQSRVLSQFFMSFSREVKEGQAKYVQDNIRLHSREFVIQLLDKKSTIYVCGDAKNMAKDVWETIAEVLENEKNISKEEADALLNSIKKEQRYIQDIWS